MPKVSFDLDDYPNLLAALKADKAEGKGEPTKAAIRTMLAVLDEGLAGETKWTDIPKMLNKDLTFDMMVKGVLHAVFDIRAIADDPEEFEALGADVHPFSLFGIRTNKLTGGATYNNWRKHFNLPDDAKIDEQTIAAIIRKMLYYAKYVKMEQWGQAIMAKPSVQFRTMGEAVHLPFYPALNYQLRSRGELQVGTFMPDAGIFNCGIVEHDEYTCKACERGQLKDLKEYRYCPDCNAGYFVENEEEDIIDASTSEAGSNTTSGN